VKGETSGPHEVSASWACFCARYQPSFEEEDVSDLTSKEKRLLEKLLGMASGYVLRFSDRTFGEFFADTLGIDIDDDKYVCNGTSKANRLRTFWSVEENHVVGKVLSEMIDMISEDDDDEDQPTADLKAKCSVIVDRLLGGVAVEDIGALDVESDERTFRLLAASVRRAIDEGNPEAALDRLHTYVVKFVRQVCEARNIDTDEKKPLHALMGEYIKSIKNDGTIESDISERILKNSIAIFESFNHVRNRHSLAHDNDLLSQAESLLIVNHIVSTIRFIQTVERA
jgi:hypothetical protein